MNCKLEIERRGPAGLRQITACALALGQLALLAFGGEDDAALKRRLADLTSRARKWDDQREGKSDRGFLVNYPLLKLKLEKAQLSLAKGGYYSWRPSSAEADLADSELLLRMLDQGREAYAGATGLQERAYLSEIDDSAQPYWLFVPKQYSPGQAWPLLVFLHGYDPSMSKIDPWLPFSDVLALAQEKGCLLLIPYGRRNTDFVGVGEEDVLRSMAETKKLFRIDDNRVYLSGVSMGGYGVYAVGLHYPDLFAALAPICGRTDHYFWKELDRSEVEPFKRFLIDADNPVDLAVNARSLPVHAVQGQRDSLVNVEHSRRMAELMKKIGYSITFDEVADEDHWIYFQLYPYRVTFDWLVGKVRDPFPKQVVYRTYSPKYHRAYWVEIERFVEAALPAEIRASCLEDNRIEVKVENVRRFSLTLSSKLVDLTKPVSVFTNGLESFQGKVKEGDRVTVFLGQTESTGPSQTPEKTPALCGPIKEVFNAPILLVYGSHGTAAETKAAKDKADRMAKEWQEFADGLPPIKPDRQVSDQDLQKRNLVLFGDARTNALIGQVAKSLPLSYDGEAVQIGQTKVPLKGRGFLMTCPNPLNPARLLLVQTGEFWGSALPINHKFDLLPDFIVYAPTPEYDGTDQFLVAGFLNNNWRFDEKLTCWRERTKRPTPKPKPSVGNVGVEFFSPEREAAEAGARPSRPPEERSGTGAGPSTPDKERHEP